MTLNTFFVQIVYGNLWLIRIFIPCMWTMWALSVCLFKCWHLHTVGSPCIDIIIQKPMHTKWGFYWIEIAKAWPLLGCGMVILALVLLLRFVSIRKQLKEACPFVGHFILLLKRHDNEGYSTVVSFDHKCGCLHQGFFLQFNGRQGSVFLCNSYTKPSKASSW